MQFRNIDTNIIQLPSEVCIADYIIVTLLYYIIISLERMHAGNQRLLPGRRLQYYVKGWRHKLLLSQMAGPLTPGILSTALEEKGEWFN